jgi:2-keto-3-deoxy-L-rhamnonate aldolase RhmA
MIMVNKIGKSDAIIGSWINSVSPIVAEIMSASGFDFLVIDTEHSAADVPQVLTICQAIKAGNPDCIPMVRLPGNLYSETKRYLDAGAMGIIAPLINTAGEAKELIRSVKYPPLGERGVGFGRSHGYGFDFEDYMQTANQNIFVCIQIEHIEAVRNIDAILSVEGIDAAFIGPYDLSASMGITAQFSHPDYIKTCDKIVSKCKQYNIMPGIHVVHPEPAQVHTRIEEGYKMIGYSLDITVLGTHFREAICQIKERMSNDTQS